MNKTETDNSFIAACPVRNVVARFGDKWSLLVLLVIDSEGTVRFNRLGRLIPDISTCVLSSTLKTLEADGLVSRKVYAEVPPKVEYSMTPTGKSLIPIVLDLTRWAQANMPAILSHRRGYASARKA